MTSIKEIAKRANVSIGTVDRVLHKRGRVSKETEALINKIIKELDYRPNIFARNLKLKKNYSFGMVMPKREQDSQYWSLPLRGIKRAVGELLNQHITINYYTFDKYKEHSLRAALDRAVNAGQDGLVIAPVQHSHLADVMAGIPDAVPFVFIDADVPEASPIARIGQDAFQSGKTAGHLMDLLNVARQPIHILVFSPDDLHIRQRVNGFKDYFCDTKIQLTVHQLASNADEQAVCRLLNQIRHEQGTQGGLFITNANTHLAARCFSQKSVPIIGYDMVKENVSLLKEGRIDFLINQKPEMQGYWAVNTLFRHVVLKENVDKAIRMPIDIITRENVEYYSSF